MTEHNRRADDGKLDIILAKMEEGKQREAAVLEALRIANEKQEKELAYQKIYYDNEFSRINRVLDPIKKGFDIVDQPIRWAGWTMLATLGGALVWFGNHLMAWIVRHFNP